jgi:hypothetical protein
LYWSLGREECRPARRRSRGPGFDDDLLVQSWMLIDFPFGPSRQTALDHF